MYHYKRAIIGPPAKRHLMAFRWRADDGPTLNAGLKAEILDGIWTYIARIPYILVIFQGGLDPLSPPLWIRTWMAFHLVLPYAFTLFRLIFHKATYSLIRIVHCIY